MLGKRAIEATDQWTTIGPTFESLYSADKKERIEASAAIRKMVNEYPSLRQVLPSTMLVESHEVPGAPPTATLREMRNMLVNPSFRGRLRTSIVPAVPDWVGDLENESLSTDADLTNGPRCVSRAHARDRRCGVPC